MLNNKKKNNIVSSLIEKFTPKATEKPLVVVENKEKKSKFDLFDSGELIPVLEPKKEDISKSKRKPRTAVFTVEDTLMEQVLEACGRRLTVIRPNVRYYKRNNEPHFFIVELFKELGYNQINNLTRELHKDKVTLLKLTNENGLKEFKETMGSFEGDPYWRKQAKQFSLLSGTNLRNFLLSRSWARQPKAKELALNLASYLDRLVVVATEGAEEIFKFKEKEVIPEPEPIIILDEVDQALMKAHIDHPEAIEVSKEISKFYFELNNIPGQQPPGYFSYTFPNAKHPIWLGWQMGYFVSVSGVFLPHKVKMVIKKFMKQQGFSDVLTQSIRNFLTFVSYPSRSCIAIIDREFLERVNSSVENHMKNGMTHFEAIQEVLRGKGKTKKLVTDIVEEFDFLLKTNYWLGYKGLLDEAYLNFLSDSRYVTKHDLALKSVMKLPELDDWNGIPLLEQRYGFEQQQNLIEGRNQKLIGENPKMEKV